MLDASARAAFDRAFDCATLRAATLRLNPVLCVCAIATATLCACGPESHHLEGSLSEVMDLTWRTSDVQQSQNELSLRFVQPQGVGENIVLRVTVSTSGTSVDPDEPVDLAEPDALGNKRGRVTRNVTDDPLQELPEVARGELVFHNPVTSGQTIPGEVHITFVEGTTVANGRTVFGTFEAKVE